MAKDGTVAGQKYNQPAIDYLILKFQTNSEKEILDIVDDFKKFLGNDQ